MRILINALSARLGGGQTYLRNLLLHAPQGEWKLFVLCPDNFDFSSLPPNVERINLNVSLLNPYRRAVWESFNLGRLARRLGVEVLFSPGGLLPNIGLSATLKTVVTFQNMLPYDHLQRRRYPPGMRRIRDWLLERGLSSAMRKADLVIFISKYAAGYIKSHLSGINGRSVVIPHGIDAKFMADAQAPLPRPSSLPAGDYFLYVSFVDFYKSQIEVVRAFAKLKQAGKSSGSLILVGAGYPPYQAALRAEISRLNLDGEVLLCGNLPHEELPALYQNAKLNIFASRTENCPNILLEMMASGRPALVSNYGPMPEFAADTVFYFDPANPDQLAERWAEALGNFTIAEDLARRAQARVANSCWNNTAKDTWRAISELGGGEQ